MPTLRALLVLSAATLSAVGCASADPHDESLGEVSEAVVAAPLGAAYCEINVTGKGVKALEDDYLPHVITCENGGANLEALKAQAIAARSVAYYNMATKGSICDGQGCQVYSCGAGPQAKHFQAVKETAGQYLSFAGALTYGFYVAGDTNTSGPSCHGSGGSTEGYVTYNWGKTGGAVKQTSLGYIGPPGFGQNRGCMGQWGARCLEKSGWAHMDILRFYYGSDIQVLKAQGPCTGGCEPTHCNGTQIVSACGKGDCAAYGATCVDDSKGVRCSSVFCPAQGQKKVCVNEKLIGDCNDGAISTGDCSMFGATCVDDAKGARCVSVFCSKLPNQAHDTCLPNGQLAHCTELGGISAEDCPADKPCTLTATGAQCGAPPPPPPSGGGGAANGSGGEAGASGAGGVVNAGGSGAFGTGGSAATGAVPSGKGGSGQQTKVVSADDEAGCSTAPRGHSSSGALFGLLGLLGIFWARSSSRIGLNRLLCLLVALLLAIGTGCSAEQLADEHDSDEVCEEPVLAQAPEALSSIDCGEHTDTGYSSGNAFPIVVVTVDGKPVERSTANAYYVMAQAAAAAGVNIKIVSGFRTMAEQQYFYGCYVNCSCNSCNLAAKPGYSNHQSGHALDLNTSSGGVLDWLNAHGGAYGFKRTVPSEAWHWEWWGGGPGGGPCGTCKPHCEGTQIVGTDCGKGDCAAYGATCVDDSKGVRCSSVFCPAQGQKKVCVNEKLIGDCNDGAISTGDCSMFGATCVDDAKGARCVSVFCSKLPNQAHDTCLPNGQLAHCTALGGISAEDCPAGKPCTLTATGAQCGAPPPPPAPSGTGGESGSGGSAPVAAGGSAGAAGSGGSWSNPALPSAGAPGHKPAAQAGSTDAVEAGCGCRAAGESRETRGAWLALVCGALGLGLRRRRA